MQDQERPSKTQRKREMHELQALGERLVELNGEQLDAVALPENLRQAVREAGRITRHEARRRQLQYIGRLMREVDAAPIREKLKVWDGLSAEHTAHVRLIERWRERLIAEEDALGDLAKCHAGIDTQHLRSLIRNAREERDAGRPPRSYRELFRVLREIFGDDRREDETG
ncbi:MAG: ribosome biogenesis factor YjgA [Burkholderiales bacterium]